MKTKISEIILGKNFSRTFGTGDVSSLAASMKTHGQITPVIIDKDKGLVAGFRRLSAAKLLGWDEIETVTTSGLNPGVINLIENMNREDLTLWEEIQALRDVFGNETDAEIARQLSKSNSWVRPRTAIWGMPPEFIMKVRTGQSGINEIKRIMKPVANKDTAASLGMNTPSQCQIRQAITRLIDAERLSEARALSYACGAIKLDDLLPE